MTYIPVDIEEAVKRECKRRRYSERTVKTYVYCINRFLKFTKKSIDRISKKDVREFLEYLSENKRTGNTMNTYHMAVRFLFEDVLDKRIWIDIKYSKVPEKLPILLSRDEVKKLFDAIENPKHKLMVQLMYGSGLRVSELINLCVKDLELEKNFGWVRSGKGGKDRIFIISEKLKPAIKELITKEGLGPEHYLFCSNRDKKYHMRSLQQIVKKAAKKAEINKNVGCHTLRHSFATHLIEDGCSISEVQTMLGHKSPKTTFIYVHAATPKLIKIKSPIDEL